MVWSSVLARLMGAWVVEDLRVPVVGAAVRQQPDVDVESLL